MSGGKGKVSGTVLGLLVIATIKNGLTLCNVDAFVQMIVEGSILIVAVLIDLLRNGSYKRQS
jgi:ribose transport system permease protein